MELVTIWFLSFTAMYGHPIALTFPSSYLMKSIHGGGKRNIAGQNVVTGITLVTKGLKSYLIGQL